MDNQSVFYILFEEAEDGCYGDILVNRKLYTMAEAEAYVRENATEVLACNDNDRKCGIEIKFFAKPKSQYGTQLFYFMEFTPSNTLISEEKKEIVLRKKRLWDDEQSK